MLTNLSVSIHKDSDSGNDAKNFKLGYQTFLFVVKGYTPYLTLKFGMINKTNLTILFFLRQDRTNRHNLTPIFCRITLDGERYSFGTRLFVVLEEWDSKKQIVNSKSPEAIQINKQLGLIKLGINEAYMNLNFLPYESRLFHHSGNYRFLQG